MHLSNKIRTAAMAALASVALAAPAVAQQQQPVAKSVPEGFQPKGMPNGWVLHTVKEGKLYWMEQPTPNQMIIIGNTSVILVDVGSDGKQLADAVAQITPKPISTVIETHGDTDHINGLYTLPNAKNIKIIAHEGNWKEQWAVTRNQLLGLTCPASPMPPMPNAIVKKNAVDTVIDGVKISFRHFGPAHTGGDLVVYLPEYKIAAIGDLAMDKDMFRIPGQPGQDHNMFWKSEKSGTPLGFFKTADELVKLGATGFVSGHSIHLLTNADVTRIKGEVKADYDKAAAMALAGKTLDETETAMGSKNYPPRGGCVKYMTLPWFAWNETMRAKNEIK